MINKCVSINHIAGLAHVTGFRNERIYFMLFQILQLKIRNVELELSITIKYFLGNENNIGIYFNTVDMKYHELSLRSLCAVE